MSMHDMSSMPMDDAQAGQGAHPIVGHTGAWGLGGGGGGGIQPYSLTPGSIDTMTVRVREKIDVLGVGTDVVDMRGVFTVRRDHPCAVGDPPTVQWGKSCVKTEFRSLELAGNSPVFGTVRVHLDPSHASHGEVGPSDMGSLAATCVAHCYPVVELPDLGLRLSTAAQPVTLASKVIQIPPVGDVARSQNSATLVDEAGQPVGEIISSDIEVGDLVASIPLGSTGGPSGGLGAVHVEGQHDTPSGPYFYSQGDPEASVGGDGAAAVGVSAGPPTGMQQPQPSAPAADLGETLLLLQRELSALAELVGRLSQG